MQKAALALMTLLLAGLPLHALGWTYLHASYTEAIWLPVAQIWKELLLALLGVLTLTQIPRIWNSGWLRNRAVQASLAYTGVVLAVAALGSGDIEQKLYGVRTALLLPVAYLLGSAWCISRGQLRYLGFVTLGAGSLVLLFGLIQHYLLPADFLRHLGYSEVVSTWAPGGVLPMYHLIGETGAIRLQSTLAGPNQLGAYTLLLLALAAGLIRREGGERYAGIVVTTAGLVVLAYTYSRSALLGLLVGVAVLLLRTWPKLSRRVRHGTVVASVILAAGGVAATMLMPGLRATLLRTASTSEHLELSLAAIETTWQNPLGLGIGSTAGGAQRYAAGLTPENMYLGAALETGWLGGVLFIAMLAAIFYELWRRDSTLAYGLLGVLTVGLFLHPLHDAPLAISLGLLTGAASHYVTNRPIKV